MNKEKISGIMLELSAAAGVSGAILIPRRYVHAPSEMVDSNGAGYTVKFLQKLLTLSWPSMKE